MAASGERGCAARTMAKQASADPAASDEIFSIIARFEPKRCTSVAAVTPASFATAASVSLTGPSRDITRMVALISSSSETFLGRPAIRWTDYKTIVYVRHRRPSRRARQGLYIIAT